MSPLASKKAIRLARGDEEVDGSERNETALLMRGARDMLLLPGLESSVVSCSGVEDVGGSGSERSVPLILAGDFCRRGF